MRRVRGNLPQSWSNILNEFYVEALGKAAATYGIGDWTKNIADPDIYAMLTPANIQPTELAQSQSGDLVHIGGRFPFLTWRPGLSAAP